MRAAQMHSAGGVGDPQIEGAAPAAEALQQRLTASQESAFHVSLYLTLCTPSAEELEAATVRVEAAGRSALCQLLPATFRQLDGRLATLPLARDPLGRRRVLDTSSLATMFPWYGLAVMLRGGIYVRISIDDEGDGKGIARHLKVARSLARERGISVPDELVFDRDNDLSGSGEVYRPDYERMVEAVKSGQVDAVVTSEIERLQRGLKEYVEFYEAAEARGLLVVWEGGSANFATGEGIDALEDAAVSARKELRKIRRRVRRKHEELLQDGKYIGQHRVFGYRWDGGLVIVEDEGELIREAVHRMLNGEALNAICRDWNQRGIRTVEGNTWGQRSLKRVLVSGRISGRRDYGIAPGGGRLAGPRIVTEGDWPAIVDPELSDEVRTL